MSGQPVFTVRFGTMEIRAQVGQGGGGADSSIPECRVCGAHGGGGHGGFCPNMNRPPEQWVAGLPEEWVVETPGGGDARAVASYRPG